MLRRASGVSTSLMKTAKGLAKSAIDNNTLMQIKTTIPASQEDGLYLKKLGVQLYNAIKNGGSTDVSVLYLRFLACHCMVGSGGSGAGDDKVDLRDLDAMRCFSKTGKGLIALGETEMGREALLLAVQLASDWPLEKIRGCFGETQEAHDCGYALFVALCGLCQLTIRAILSKGTNAQGHFNEMILLLRKYSVYLSAIDRSNQLKLRSIIEDGIQLLDLPNSILLQRYLFDEWESLISTTIQYNVSVASYLAYSLSEAGDLSGALAALERAETLRTALHPLGSRLAQSDIELGMARCAVSVLKLKDEFKIYSLVTHATFAEDASDLTSAQVRRYEDVRQECISKFRDLAMLVNRASKSNALTNLLWSCLINIVPNVYTSTQAFEASYLTILALSGENLDRISNIILRMLDHDASDVATFLGLPKVKTAMEALAKSKADQTVIKVAQRLWNVACDLQGGRKWREMECVLHAVGDLVEQDSALKLRANLCYVFACMHTKLPDKDGNQENEMQLLRSFIESMHEVIEHSGDLQVSKLAALTELVCMIRLASIDDNLSRETVLKAIKEYSDCRYLDDKSLLALTDEAHILQAIELETDLLHLVLRFGNERNTDDGVRQSVQQARQKLVRLLLKQYRLSAVEEAIVQWLDVEKSRREEDCILDMNSRSKLATALRQHMESTSNGSVTTVAQMLDKALLAYVCGRLVSETDPSQRTYFKSAVGQSVQAGITLLLSEKDDISKLPENMSLLVQCGERAAKVLFNIPDEVKREDQRLGICAVFSTIFMAAGIAEADGIVADRLAAICDEGEYASPASEGLVWASKFARYLDMKTTSKLLILRSAEFALQEDHETRYDAVIRISLHSLIKTLVSISEAIKWIGQIDKLVQSNKMHPLIIQSLAITLWNRLVSLRAVEIEIYQLSAFWLELACQKDAGIRNNRHQVLEKMRARISTLSERKNEDQNHVQASTNDIEDHENVSIASNHSGQVIPDPGEIGKALDITSKETQPISSLYRVSASASGLEGEQLSTEDEDSDENTGAI